MSKILSQRDAFFNTLYAAALKDKDIVVVTADMGAPSLDQIRKNLPGQFVNVGIAEQNAITVAAGLAMSGKKVFTYAIAPFITIRCLEQIRVECSIMDIPVHMIGVGAGFGYPDSGPTHHILEDIAIMRAIPGITTYNITDSIMAENIANICINSKHSCYIRLDRSLTPGIYSPETSFDEGVQVIRKHEKKYIIATGCMVNEALEIADELKKEGIEAGVIDVYKFPAPADIISEVIGRSESVITLEEHFLDGGLGSVISEIITDKRLCPTLSRIGMNNSDGFKHCYTYGGRDILRGKYGLSRDQLYERIKADLT